MYSQLPGSADFDEAVYYLGKLCKNSHEWQSSDFSLRALSTRKCVQCEKERRKKRYYANIEEERRKARERMNNRNANLTNEQRIAKNKKQNDYLRTHGRPSRANRHVDTRVIVFPGQRRLETEIWRAIRNAGQCPSVARLVMDEQLRYWREHPESKHEHRNQWNRDSWWLRYQINPYLRLYNRQKSKRRKAAIRNSLSVQLSGAQISNRFAQFDCVCAYCGAAGDLHIEHVVPISKGGTHSIGNIVPSCPRCNYSKHAHEVESWYRAQPFYSDLRWRKICRVLGWSRSSVGQLALL